MERTNIDLSYICSKTSDLSGLPIRIYTGKKLDALFSIAPLLADPVMKYEKDLLKRKEHVSYFITEYSDYYGVIRSGNKTIIIGPSRSVPYTVQEISDIAFDLNISGKDYNAFERSMRSILPMPLGSILQMMLTLNYSLNDEKLDLTDLGFESPGSTDYFTFDSESSPSDYYKNYNAERHIHEMVVHGDVSALDEWARTAPTIRPSMKGPNQLRQEKNTLIVEATLVSRAAIEAGVDVEDAIKMSDSFIQRCESLHDISDLRRLQYELVRTYTAEVGNLRRHTDDSRLVHEVYRYIINHISDTIRADDIADALYLSRSYLCTSFKKKTGIPLNEYIHRLKIDRAKELLKDPTKSITLIGEYLGYSSASHFNRVFKKITSMSPLTYRKTV